MIRSATVLAVAAGAPLAMAGNLVEMPLDSSNADNLASFDGFYIDDQRGTEVARAYLEDGWNVGRPFIHLDAPVNIAAFPSARIQLDVRYHQVDSFDDGGNLIRPEYDDAAFFVYLIDSNGDNVGLPWSPQFADLGGDVWYTYDIEIATNTGNWPDSGGDLSDIVSIAIGSTNWDGDPTQDYLHLSNLVITPTPGAAGLLALAGLAGARRRR